MTPEIKAAFKAWKNADTKVKKLIAAGGGGDREAFFEAMKAANEASDRLQAARLKELH